MASEHSITATDHAVLTTDAPTAAQARARATPAIDPATDRAAEAGAANARASWTHRLLGPYARPPARWSSRQVFFVTMGAIALLYLGLYHPYWARGGDSELYLVLARSLLRGDGYTYNNQPVALVPPLWSIVIAAGMWLTSVVGVLKLMMPALFLLFLGCAYHVLLRIASPWIAAASVVLTALLHGLVILTMWFHSDALFFALSWIALLLALQAGERHAQGLPRRAWLWRAGGATLCLMGAVATRWPGVLWWPMIAVAFLHGRHLFTVENRRLSLALRPRRFDAMWIAAVASGILTALTFFGLRALLKVDAADLDPRYDTFESGHYDIVNQYERPTIGTHLNRLLRGPEWLSRLYWAELAQTPGLALPFSRLAAVTVIPLAVAGIVGVWRRQWIWLGVAAAWVPIIATWPHAIDRYSGPVAPLLVCGTILGTIWTSKWIDRRLADRPRARRELRRLPYIVMTVPLLVCLSYNVGRYGLEVWARQDYFVRYEGGIQPSLNRIGAYLRQNQPAVGGEVAVTRTGVRPGKSPQDEEERFQRVRGVQRNLVFLSDMPSIVHPAIEDFSASDPWFVEWAAMRNVRYFVVRPKDRRYFVHLRDLPWHAPATALEREAEDYALYELPGGEIGLPVWVRRVDVGAWPQEVLIVPGLEDVRQAGRWRRWLPIPYN